MEESLSRAWSGPFISSICDGNPATTCICYGVHNGRSGDFEFRLCVGTTLPKWPEGSCLYYEAKHLYERQYSRSGRRKANEILAEYDRWLPAAVNPRADSAELRASMAAVAFDKRPKVVDLGRSAVQSYKTNNGQRRDRCIRCKGTFHF